MKKRMRLIFTISVLLISLIPLKPASANGMPPPSELWFTFDFPKGQIPTVERFSLIFCSDRECSLSAELAQIPNSPDMPHGNRLYCYENWCKWELYPPTDSYSSLEPLDLTGFGSGGDFFFMVKVLFSDGLRTSNVARGISRSTGIDSHFLVTENTSALALSQDPAFSSPVLTTDTSPYFLTLLAEPILFSLLAWLWLKRKFRETIISYGIALLANLISWPMVWSFFPSIALYHYKRDELFGLVILLIGLVFSFLIAAPIHGTQADRAILRILGVILLPVACFFSSGLVYGSRQTEIVNAGLPVPLAIALIEICAVLYEGIFVYHLSGKSIPWRQALILSLLTNTASFGLGLVVL